MRKTLVAICALAALAGCSKQEPKKAEAAETKPRVTFESPVKFSEDPKVMRGQQEALVDAMIKDPHLDLETIQGEAYRRGVTLRPEQIAYKKAHPVDRAAPWPSPSAPGGNASSEAEAATANAS